MKSFSRDAAGNITLIFALMLVPLVLTAGMAIDYIRMVNSQTKLQAAADAAALAGASYEDGTESERRTAAISAFQFGVSEEFPGLMPSISFAPNKVTVSVAGEVDPSFMSIAGFGNLRIAVDAVARHVAAEAPTCALALEPSEQEALMINSDSRIDAPDCTLRVNSTHSRALYGNGNGDVIASKTCVKGGWYMDSSSTVTPAAENCPAIADPLASLPVPAAASGACNHTDRTVSGTVTLSPGVYCGKLELNAGARVTFQPGIYIKKNGEFIVNSGSRATGNGVMFYLTGTNNSRFNINSGSHIDFKAPSTGPYAGIVFFQQRNITGADFSILNSDSSSKIEGTVYLPSTALKLNSYGELSADTPWTIVIAKKVEVNSFSVLRLNANYASSTVPVPAGLGGGSGTVRLTD